MIRIIASLVHTKSGAELLRHDSLPVARTELRDALGDTAFFIFNESGYTIEEGDVHLVLRIEGGGRGAYELQRSRGFRVD